MLRMITWDGATFFVLLAMSRVVATQVVSEFLSVEAGGERAYLESAGRPVAVYTYRLALTRV